MFCFCKQCCYKFYSICFYLLLCKIVFFLFWWGQIHLLSIPHSALYHGDLPTHIACISQTPVSSGLLLGLAQWEALAGERGERSQSAYLFRSDGVSSVAPTPIAQVYPDSRFCPETLTHSWSSVTLFLISVDWDGSGF